MGYEIELSPDAADDLRKHAPRIQRVIIAGLHRLGESPVKLSQPSICPPYLPGYQMYQFAHKQGVDRNLFTALFKYRADEEMLWIYAIVHQEVEGDYLLDVPSF